MKVKKTYGKQKTAALEGSFWKKGDDTFDRLMLENEEE